MMIGFIIFCCWIGSFFFNGIEICKANAPMAESR